MKNQPKNQRGFTLVELLVVVLILAILMAVALPLYLSAIKNSEKGTARANMQTIANAEQSYKLQNTAHTYLSIPTGGNTADWTALADSPTPIQGPGTRTYGVTPNTTASAVAGTNCLNGEMVPAGSFVVVSSDPTDGCFIPGVTSQ